MNLCNSICRRAGSGNYISNYRNTALVAELSDRGAVVGDNAVDNEASLCVFDAATVSGAYLRCASGALSAGGNISSVPAVSVSVVDDYKFDNADARRADHDCIFVVGRVQPADADFLSVVEFGVAVADAGLPKPVSAVLADGDFVRFFADGAAARLSAAEFADGDSVRLAVSKPDFCDFVPHVAVEFDFCDFVRHVADFEFADFARLSAVATDCGELPVAGVESVFVDLPALLSAVFLYSTAARADHFFALCVFVNYCLVFELFDFCLDFFRNASAHRQKLPCRRTEPNR